MLLQCLGCVSCDMIPETALLLDAHTLMQPCSVSVATGTDLGKVEDEIFKRRRETELDFRRRQKEKRKRQRLVCFWLFTTVKCMHIKHYRFIHICM